MNNPQYTEQQAQLLYDVLIHHSAATLMPHFDTVAARELDEALAVLRMDLSMFIAESYISDHETYDNEISGQDWEEDGY